MSWQRYSKYLGLFLPVRLCLEEATISEQIYMHSPSSGNPASLPWYCLARQQASLPEPQHDWGKDGAGFVMYRNSGLIAEHVTKGIKFIIHAANRQTKLSTAIFLGKERNYYPYIPPQEECTVHMGPMVDCDSPHALLW